MYSMQGYKQEYKTQTESPTTGDFLFDLLFAQATGRALPMLDEAQAEAVATVAAFAADEEDEDGLIEMLALEEEARSGYRSLYTFGPCSDF